MLGKAESLKFTKRVKSTSERDRKQKERKKAANRRRADQRSRLEAYNHWASHVVGRANFVER